MRQILKRLLKMVAGYGAIQWAGPFLSFIFTPIITRLLNPSDYGVADFVLTVASAMGTLVLFAQPQALTAHFNDKPHDLEWQRTLTGSSIALCCCIGIPIGLIVFLLAAPISQITILGYTHLYQIIGLTVVFGILSGILTATAQAALRVRWGMLFSTVSIVSTVAGNIVYIIVLRLGATGMVLTPVTTGITLTVTALLVMRKKIGKPNLELARILFSSGLILLPTMIAGWTLNVVDRFFLVQYVSTESLGYYAIANKIASLLGVLMSPLYVAWTPIALSIQLDPASKNRYAIMSRYIIGAALLAGLGLGLFAKEILLVLTRESYLPAAPYVGFLTCVHVLSAFSTVLYTSALVGKQLKAVSIATVAGAILNVILNAILIPPYGIWGATIATVIGFAAPVILLYFMLRAVISVPYPVFRLTGALIVQMLLLVIGLYIPSVNLIARVAIKAILLLILPVLLVALGIITTDEIRQVLEVARLSLVSRTRHNKQT